MGLKHPEDLAAWRAWQAGARSPLSRLSALKSLLRNEKAGAEPSFSLYLRGERPRIVTVMESFSPSALAAQRSWTAQFDASDVAVAAPSGLGAAMGEGASEHVVTYSTLSHVEALRHVTVVVGPGHFLPIGQALYDWSEMNGVASFVVQHGLMTALAPPLPGGSTLLAWTEADGNFWRSGRGDVDVVVVGSQLYWDVARPGESVSAVVGPELTFLGQLHGAELPQAQQALSAVHFCLRTGAHYRPHPGENDLGSRLWHRVMKARGVTFADTSIPLRELDGAVVSAFSTGVLEAASRGCPAFVHYDHPPAWLQDFWQRYDMRSYDGGSPTPAPPVPAQEPAQVIATTLRKAIDR